MNIKFDLIIANPPYGKPGANITKNISDNVYFEEYVNLLPMNDYKRNDSKDLFRYAREMENINDGFKDAAVTTHLCKIAKEPNNITLDEFEISNYIDRSLDKYFTENRNRQHYAFDSVEFSGATDIQFKEFKQSTTVVFGSRDICNGHLAYKKDIPVYKYNYGLINNTELFEARKATRNGKYDGWLHVAGITFNTEIEKDNLVKFIYSEDGFRFISKVFTAMNIDGTINAGKVFPKVDWTHSWTVEEILKDYGYTDIEIENIMEDLNNFRGMDD